MADFYNFGSGLTDITATQVKSDFIITDNINTSSGLLELNNSDLVHVNLINGYDLDAFNQKIIFSSNLVISTSNVAHRTSNTANATSNFIHDAIDTGETYLQCLKNRIITPNLFANHLVQCSNLEVYNTLIRVNGSNLVDVDTRIDYKKWIKNGPVFKEDNTFEAIAVALAGGALGLGIGLAVAGKGMFTSFGNIAKDLGDKLKDVFDDDADDGNDGTDDKKSDKQYISFKNIKTIPKSLAYDRPKGIDLPGGVELEWGSGLIAFRDNLYVSNSRKLCGVSSLNFGYDGELNSYKFNNSSAPIGKTTIIDFSSKAGYLDSVQSSTGNDYTLNSTGLTANRVKVGNFYVTPQGIFLGNPANILTSKLIIDNNGTYKGTIGLSQITDLESLNFRSIGNGTVVYDNVMAGYTGQTTGMSVNSFANYWNNAPQFTGSG
jgi:hypothetical protein